MHKAQSFIGIVLLLLFPSLIYGQKANISSADSQLLNLFKEAKFCGNVLLARNGKVVYKKSIGFADIEHGVRNNSNTKFELASVSKAFTAILILQLVERGKINLEDHIAKYFPEFTRTDGQKITIHHLLSHTSGIQDFVGLNCEFSSWTRKEYMEALEKTPINFPAGTQFEYASSTYVLLRFLIEKVTGRSYEDNLRTNILEVAGMSHSGVVKNEEIIADRAFGYYSKDGKFLNALPISSHNIFIGAASIYSTTFDILKFDQALYTNRLLGNASKEKMFTIVKPPYGYGWFIEDDPKKGKILSHGGDIFGFTTLVERKLKSRTLIVILGNLQGIDRDRIVKVLDGF